MGNYRQYSWISLHGQKKLRQIVIIHSEGIDRHQDRYLWNGIINSWRNAKEKIGDCLIFKT